MLYFGTVWKRNPCLLYKWLNNGVYRAARWIKSFWDPSTYQWSKSSVTCVEELGWPSLKARRIYISIWTLYCILHKTTAIDFSRYFHFNTLPTRSHSLTLNLLSSTINAFRHSFLLPHLCYGTPYHLTFYLNQLRLFLNINLSIFFFLFRYFMRL